MDMLLVGYSVRALAESVVKYSFRDVVAVDFFGDWDLRHIVDNVEVVESREHLSTILERYAKHDVIYSSVLENDVVLLNLLGDRVIGNGAEVVEIVRPGEKWWNIAGRLRIRIPNVLTGMLPCCSGRWLKKPYKSGGGRSISFWSGEKLPAGFYLQEFIDGESFSFLFVSNGKDLMLLGVTLQLVGVDFLGAHRFAWSGNVYPANLEPDIVDEVKEWIARLTCEVGLCGVFGVDVIVKDSIPYVIEINPRYTGSMELIETALGINIFGLHMGACRGNLPLNIPEPLAYFGKGIVYAEVELCGFRSEEMWNRGFRDIPVGESVIHKGSPVCSVFSSGGSIGEVIDGLIEQKRWLYEKGVRTCV